MVIYNRWRMQRVSVALVAAAALGCDGSPTSPGRGAPPAQDPPAPTITRIEIVDAPPSIETGVAVQLHAVTVRSDGAIDAIPAQAQWASADSGIVRVSSGGLAAALARGETLVTVRYLSFSASARILVLPQGTFKLSGRVLEAGAPVGGVSLEVTSGTGQGLATTTADDGAFALYGVAGRVAVHVRKDGYLNKTERLEIAEHATHDVEIVPSRDRADLSGTYSLTLTVGSGCRTLPEHARQRAYTATITQSGPELNVTLTDADFIITAGRGDHFGGTVDLSDSVRFAISDPLTYYYWYYASLGGPPDIAERLTSSTAIVVVGHVDARRSGSTISGRLNGVIIILEAPGLSQINSSVPWVASCYSDRHEFVMRRR